MAGAKKKAVTSKWEPAKPQWKPDNILASEFTNILRKFTPSYENELRPNLWYLLGFEYQRMYLKELKEWNKALYPKEIKQPYYVRELKRKLPKKGESDKDKKPERFILKKFQNIRSKVSTFREQSKQSSHKDGGKQIAESVEYFHEQEEIKSSQGGEVKSVVSSKRDDDDVKSCSVASSFGRISETRAPKPKSESRSSVSTADKKSISNTSLKSSDKKIKSSSKTSVTTGENGKSCPQKSPCVDPPSPGTAGEEDEADILQVPSKLLNVVDSKELVKRRKSGGRSSSALLPVITSTETPVAILPGEIYERDSRYCPTDQACPRKKSSGQSVNAS